MNQNDPSLPLAEAASWRIRLMEMQCDTTEEFRAWLLADSQNKAAWSRVQVPWEILGKHAASPLLVHLRHSALAHGPQARVDRFRLRRLRSAAAVGIGAAAILLAAVMTSLWETYHFDVYHTRAGERRLVTLSDGSEIALDSHSEVRVRYGKHSRELALTMGQARFNVMHDILRPFSVTAGQHQVVATGTSFNVDLLGPELLVTLIEGHVVVLPQNSPAQQLSITVPNPALEGKSIDPVSRIVLDAGEQLVLSPTAVPSVIRVNVDHAVAWENGTLVFDNEPLSSVVLRVGRYGGHPIVIADDATSKLRISGVFHEGDVEGFLSTVVSYLSIKSELQQDGAIRLSSRTQADRS